MDWRSLVMKDLKFKIFGDDWETDKKINAFLAENIIEYVDLKYLGENGVLLVYREKENTLERKPYEKYPEKMDDGE